MKVGVKQQSRIEAYMNQYKSTAEKEEYKDLTIITFVAEIRGTFKPCLAIWKGKQSKPFINFSYVFLDHRNTTIKKEKEMADLRFEQKEQKKAERKAFTPDLNVGDIYVDSWGYEQTQVDFYQIIEVVGKHTAVFQAIASETVDGSQGHDCDQVVAVKDAFVENSEPFKKRVTKHGIKINSFSNAYKWDGSPRHRSWYY